MKIWQAGCFADWRFWHVGFHVRDKRICQKVKSAFARIRYLRPRAGACGNTRFSRGGGKTACHL